MTFAEYFLLLFVLVCAITDVLKHKIFNVVTFPIFFAGLTVHIIRAIMAPSYMEGLSFIGVYLGVGFLWFIAWFLMYLFRIVSAGDVKFFMALYAWLGMPDGIYAAGFILMAAGLVAVFFMIKDGRFADVLKNKWEGIYSYFCVLGPDIQYRRPLGVAMFMGTCAYLIWK